MGQAHPAKECVVNGPLVWMWDLTRRLRAGGLSSEYIGVVWNSMKER
jgi:hypothetical protein